MRLPAYIKLSPIKSGKMNLTYKMTIKRWGVPFLLLKVLQEKFELKWYQWLLYPVFCVKIMRDWGKE